MNHRAKRIKPTLRPSIENVKVLIRDAQRPFDGDGYVFMTALSEVRKEGLTVRYAREKDHYVVVR